MNEKNTFGDISSHHFEINQDERVVSIFSREFQRYADFIKDNSEKKLTEQFKSNVIHLLDNNNQNFQKDKIQQSYLCTEDIARIFSIIDRLELKFLSYNDINNLYVILDHIFNTKEYAQYFQYENIATYLAFKEKLLSFLHVYNFHSESTDNKIIDISHDGLFFRYIDSVYYILSQGLYNEHRDFLDNTFILDNFLLGIDITDLELEYIEKIRYILNHVLEFRFVYKFSDKKIKQYIALQNQCIEKLK